MRELDVTIETIASYFHEEDIEVRVFLVMQGVQTQVFF